MALHFQTTKDKHKRVIIDTDAACEADDPFAIAHALMSPTLEVQGITAVHFRTPGSMQQSYQEILRILDAMHLSVPVFAGEDGPLAGDAASCDPLPGRSRDEISPASRFLIEEALRPAQTPLYVLCIGALTNIASALLAAPEIASRMTILWVGAQNPAQSSHGHWEFNSGNDVAAANHVLSSGVPLWLIPNNVYGTMHIGMAEVEHRIAPCGAIGKHLFENMASFNISENAGWTAGESWSLGDSAAVGILLEPNCGDSFECPAPYISADTFCHPRTDSPVIRVYRSVNSRFIIEDFIAKLTLCYRPDSGQ